MIIRSRLYSVLGLLAAFALVPGPAIAAPEPFEINAVVSLTGSAAFLGKSQAESLAAIERAVNRSGGIGGRPVKFVIADDQSTPQVGVQLMNGIIAKKAAAVIGASIVAVCSAMVPLVADGPAVYCLSPGLHPVDGSFAFSAEPSTKDLLVASARFFKQRGWSKIAIITSSDATGQDAERGIDGAFTEPGGFQIVDREHFNTTDVTVAAQIARVKASGAQAMIAWTTGTPLGTILRSVSDSGLALPIETTNGNLTYAQMKAYASFMPRELYFPAAAAFAPAQLSSRSVKAKVAQFVDAFKAFGIRPDAGHVIAWDPALLVIDAYRKYGTNATAAQIRDYIDGVHDWAGINGDYDFRAVPQRGVGADNVIMVRWDTPKDAWVGMSKSGGEPLKVP